MSFWFTSQTARFLGLSRPEIYRLQKEGEIVGQKNEFGWWMFDRDSVEAFKRTHTRKRRRRVHQPLPEGELARRCYDAWDQGMTLNDAVRQFALVPEKARKWYREWLADSDKEPLGPQEKIELDIKRAELDIERETLALKREQGMEKAMRAAVGIKDGKKK
jgi:hypothetical protein